MPHYGIGKNLQEKICVNLRESAVPSGLGWCNPVGLHVSEVGKGASIVNGGMESPNHGNIVVIPDGFCYIHNLMEPPGIETPPSLKPCPQCGTMVMFHFQDSRYSCPQCHYLLPDQVAHYKLLQIIGTGGMGAVYRGLDISLERNVAVKVMREEFAKNPQFVESFLREARAAASLNHPNVAQIYSFGEQDGRYYLVMELLPGGSLDDRIEKEHHVAELDVLDVGIQVASGLRAAYERGLIHRDIKPGNILFSHDGTAKVVDFGLARFVTKAHAQHQEEGIWGTPYYIAPEKVSQNKEDFRSDIYSLGGTLFHALAGRPPFDAGTSTEVVLKHLHSPAVSLKAFVPDCTDQCADVIGRMLRREPGDRPKTYDELINALAYAKRFALAKKPPAPIEVKKDFSMAALLGTAGVIFITLLLLLWGWFHRQQYFGGDPGLPSPPSTNGVVQSAHTDPTPPTPPVPSRDELQISIDNAHETSAQEGAVFAIARFEAILDRLPENHDLRPWVHLHLARARLMAGRDAQGQLELADLTGTRTPESFAAEMPAADYPAFLAMILRGKISSDVFNRVTLGMPPWMQAIAYFDAGLAAQKADNLSEGARYWRVYADLASVTEGAWAFAYQPLARDFANEYEQFKALETQVSNLQSTGKAEQVADLLKEKQAVWQIPSIRQRVIRLGEVNRLVLAKKKAEQEEKIRQDAALKQQMEAEAKLIDNMRKQRVIYLPGYQFEELQSAWKTLLPDIKTDTSRKVVQYNIDVARSLAEFKQGLARDIKAWPYEGQKVVTRTNRKMMGSLCDVRDDKLVFRVEFGPGQSGETFCRWQDLAPSAIVEIADHYLDRVEKVPEPNNVELARRSLALAVFTREYALAETLTRKYLSYAMNTQSNIREQVDKLFPASVPR